MKLKEWIEKNCDKEIEFKDGKLTIKEPEVKGRWKPDRHEFYRFLGVNGNISCEAWVNHRVDHDRWSVGNVFKTEEEARNMIERLKICAEMLDLGGGEHFKPNEVNHRISYNHHTGRLVLDVESIFQDPFVIYFDRDVSLIGVIEKIGESRIKKYLFGVDDEKDKE